MTRTRLLKIERGALFLLVLLYIIMANAHARLAPLTTGPDELAHYEYTNFIAEQGRLPLNSNERAEAAYKSDQPPLYHLLVALPASLVDTAGPPHLKRYNDHERRPLIAQTRHAWGLYNTEDEQSPYSGEILRWHIGRWMSILFGAATIIVTYFIARGLSPMQLSRKTRAESFFSTQQELEQVLLALSAAAVVAFIPRFVLTGSMLNYETMLTFFAALFLWMLLRIENLEWRRQKQEVQTGSQPNFSIHHSKLYILLGIFTGLAIATKLSALILPVVIVIALGLIAHRYDWLWWQWLRVVAVTAIATLLTVSWWFGFVIYQFNTVAQDGLWTGLLRPLIAADASDATTNRLLSFLTGGQAGFTAAIDNLDSGPPWEWLATIYRTFWVVGIEGQQPLGLTGLLISLVFCIIAIFGLIHLWQNSTQPTNHPANQPPAQPSNQSPISISQSPSPNLQFLILILYLAAAFILPLIRYATTLSLADTAQGRHILFLTAPAFAILLVWGLAAATRRLSIVNYQLSIINYLPLVLVLFLLFWSLVQLRTMSWAYLPPLPVQTTPLPTELTYSLDEPINDFITLLGYESRLDVQYQTIRVDLYWQATAVSPVDYLTEIKLLDRQGNEHSQWLGYAAGGRYPTRAWDSGDIVRDTAWLPVGNLEAGDYTLSVNLLPTTQANPLVGLAIPSLNALPLNLGEVTLPSIDPFVSIEQHSFIDSALAMTGYTVRQNGVPLTDPATFRYRETLIVTFNTSSPNESPKIQIVGPDSVKPKLFDPTRQWTNVALFIVGPDWATGDYRLQLVDEDDSPITSEPLFNIIDRWDRNFTEPPLSHRLDANFAEQVKLLGYDLPERRVQPGGGLPMTLYWQGLDWMGHSYTIFTRLLAVDQTAHGGRDRLPREGYRTLYWSPGEIVTDSFGVPIDADAPDGIYYLNLGLYRETDQQAVSLPLIQDGQPIDTTSITIGPIKVGDTPPEFVLDSANPQVMLDQSFGVSTTLTLLGYDLSSIELQSSIAGSQSTNESQTNNQPADQPTPSLPNSINSTNSINSLTLQLYWRSEAPISIDYTTFVHLRNATGETIAQQDQPPLNGHYPTSLWSPGETIADEIVLPIPSDLSPGIYDLVIGLYNFRTGERLPVPDHPENSLLLTTVEVNR